MEPQRSPGPLFSTCSVLVTDRLCDFISRVAEWEETPGAWEEAAPHETLPAHSEDAPHKLQEMIHWLLMATQGREKFLSILSTRDHYVSSDQRLEM